jgi:carbonic anhydrase
MSKAHQIAVVAALAMMSGTTHVVCPTIAADEPSARSDVHHYFSKVQHKPDVEWGYTGARGPAFWSTLSPKFKIARDGKRQSPIDIQLKKANTEALPPLRFEYRKERLSAINNGHTIQHNEQPGSFLHVGELTFALEQFHVHVPSEHTIDGQHAAMEVHFVHKSKSGDVAVLAVLVQPGTKNAVNPPRYKELPKESGEEVEVENAFRNPLDLLPKDHSYVTYPGSFTTPPCTEGVRWIVMTTPINIRPEALAEFKRTIGGNNRPVQPLRGRRVLRDAETTWND